MTGHIKNVNPLSKDKINMTKTMNANLKPEKSKSLKSNAHVESAPIYLKLYHGRDAVDEKLADWGYDGPTFSPLTHVQVTYGDHIKFSTADDVYCELFWNENDLVKYDGKFYGDMTICTSFEGDLTRSIGTR